MEATSRNKAIPYGVYNFASLREGNCYYVDKTRYIKEIEDSSRYFFFIRPHWPNGPNPNGHLPI
jgi:hypothetical protein